MFEFRLPSLGADMEAGRLTRWLVKPGDTVHRGDIVAVVETEKSDIDVEIWHDGVVDAIAVPEGERVPVGTLLATLRTAGEPPGAVAPLKVEAVAAKVQAVAPAKVERTAPVKVETVAPRATAEAPTGGALRASPAARRRADELGVDLARVAGTGPRGAIQLDDVERAAKPPAPAPAPVAPPVAAAVPGIAAPPTEDRNAAMRHAIALAMARSNREIPHYYLATDVPMDRALAWLEAENRKRSVEERLLPAALLLRAVALALRDVPELNGFFVDGAPRPSAAVHLGVAIAVRGGGLIAPALHDADRKSVFELMTALADLVRRARSGGLRSSEMTDATITVTNLGDLGVDSTFGVIYPPQLALVGFGRIRERPWAEGGMIGARPVVTVSLAADHRATDGHRGGQFLQAVAERLLSPEKL